jgi:hypothetical protein
MRKKTVYPAHPISGDVEGNIRRIKAIVRKLHLTPGIQPVAPYISDCDGILDDNNPEERALGIAADVEYFKRGMIDEVWLFGSRISNGMSHEIRLALDLGIPVVAKTAITACELKEFPYKPAQNFEEAAIRCLYRLGPIPYTILAQWLQKRQGPMFNENQLYDMLERGVLHRNDEGLTVLGKVGARMMQQYAEAA